MEQPARAMSREDAFTELKQLESDGVILLEDPSSVDAVSLDGWNPSTASKEDGNVAGVVVRYLASGVSAGQSSGGAAPDRLDPRNAIALVRLCRWLSDTYGATELFHLGISGGGVDQHGAPRVDCHGQGRAVDLVGASVATEDGGTARVTVSDDWGSVSTAATPGGVWPDGTGSATSFRLDDPDADEWTRDFFRSLYEFIAGQWQDRTSTPDQADTPTTIGAGSFIMHPDHPDSSPPPHGRSAHRNHIHMQIGVTGTA